MTQKSCILVVLLSNNPAAQHNTKASLYFNNWRAPSSQKAWLLIPGFRCISVEGLEASSLLPATIPKVPNYFRSSSVLGIQDSLFVTLNVKLTTASVIGLAVPKRVGQLTRSKPSHIQSQSTSISLELGLARTLSTSTRVLPRRR